MYIWILWVLCRSIIAATSVYAYLGSL